MPYKRKTWQQKLHTSQVPKTEVITATYAGFEAGATMYVPTPEVVDNYIKHIPPGTATTLQQMRKDLAAENNASFTCPLTSGIFLRISAEAAWEEVAAGKPIEEVTPFWRIIDKKSPAFKKLTFDNKIVLSQRASEGL